MNAATFVSQSYDTKEFSDFVYDFLPDFGEDEEGKDPQGTVFTGIKRLGKDETLDLAVYEFRHGRKDPRVTLTRDAFKVLKNYEYSCNGALAVFVNDKNKEYRFSLITSGLEKDPKTGRIKTAWSNPRRFSFVLGGGITRNTPAKRLDGEVQNIEELKERFSVETLTKDFYVEIEDWFLRAKDKVEFPGYKYLKVSKGEHQAKMTLRLITRLIFIWFLKEKGLVPKELFDEAKIDELLNRKKFSDLSPYYRAILQNLFFATLNTPRNKREWLKGHEYHGMNSKRGDQEYFRYRDFFKGKEEQKEFYDICDKIPFVNGGLFENLDGVKADDDTQRDNEKRIDCFSEEKSNRLRLKVPDKLFFGDKGLIEILKRYNFTIEENTPNDEDVALDPELLGRVFENLLAYVNPETSEPARNSSGSFYTPREIVDYMASESLKAYLSAKIDDPRVKSLFEPAFDADEFNDADEFKDAVAKALDDIKILDPACGSGAFPMGILSKLIQILERIGKIDPGEPKKIYKKKLQIIQDCIYGVDIQDIAVQISKLRFFISLLCDQVVKLQDENYGIETLPNLETKVVCADTLKKLQESEYDFAVDKKINNLKDELFEIRREYFNEKGKADKRRLRKNDKKIREELGERITEFVQNMIDRGIAEEERKINQCNKALEEIKEPKYEYIAAPEQLELGLEGPVAKKPQQQKIKIDVNEQKRAQLKREISKSEDKIFRLERDRETDPSIMEAKAVAEWNPYDPSKCAEFFSPKWMFGTTEVFDVVIGNPPYIQLQNDNGKLAKEYENCGYETFARTGDIYCLFYERGQQLLKSGGHLCFITSNKWMRAGYGESIRKFFATRTNPKLLIDFAGVKVFKSATVDTNILLFSNSVNEHKTRCAVANRQNENRANNLSVFVEQENTTCDFSGGDSWVILSDIEKSIKRKIEAAGTPLRDWDINIYRGVLTGYNDAFIISGEKRKEILANCEPSAERKRTAALIRPILRGRDIQRYGYEWADLWLIATFPSLNYDIDQYPAVKKHLLSFGIKRLEQTGKEYIINGEKIKARKKTSNKWFEVQDSISYWEEFSRPKIIYPNMTKFLPFVYDDKAFLTNQKCFIITGNNISYLTAFLNSSLFKFCFRDSFPELLGGTRELSRIFFERIPVLRISEKENLAFKKVVEDIQNKYTKEKAIRIDTMLFDLYNLTKEERDLIGFIEIL